MSDGPKILVFGASNSSVSINHILAVWAAEQFSDEVEIKTIRIIDFDLPIFGVDLEKEIGKHPEAQKFIDLISNVDGIIISLAEHNGSYTTAFKNLLDWSSRIEGKVWQNKPILVLSTSPGRRGGASVMKAFLSHMPFMGADIKGSLSLPSFNDNFDEKNGIIDTELRALFEEHLKNFTSALAL